ncbi:carboxylic ester hydrolase [Microtetraspora sp. NBRC 13810]|uniref:carboxylesterase/lipase family protein n=1 Tax=Microtetraspora sp. NBRC 13810 TaxID=3030990 RepID=UPI002552AD92|nr:carboxylesterase family protein [Microtetraspora sp. NBRC 13810]GLW08762.1 carboxylic ester hydrolase [Microtetraspora sp. NBRC 13810]
MPTTRHLALALLATAVGCATPHTATSQTATPQTAIPRTAAPDPTLVSTDDGPVRGAATATVRTFQGIPYAAPPTGDLRWKGPRPVASWRAALDARKPRGACPQPSDQPIAIPSTNEDCLYLNVTTPAGPGRDLPVIVWIHGGSFVYGDGASYGAERLAARGKAVVVTVNYRLGAFGLMVHPGLDAPANLSLLDQRAALRWVRRNASAFGGDAGNVTIMGQSAGGFSVCGHLAAPGSAGLFQRAIVQSASCAGSPDAPYDLKRARAAGVALAKAAGCPEQRTAERCLRRKSTAEVLAAAESGHEGYRLVVDGEVLPKSPADAFATGKFNRVPVLYGSTHDEEAGRIGSMEAMTGKPLTTGDYIKEVTSAFGGKAGKAGKAGKVLAEYPVGAYGSPGEALAAVMTDSGWATPVYDSQRALAPHVPLYAYELNEAESPYFRGFPRPSFPLGTGHMIDLAYLFENALFEPLTGPQARLADAMVDRWSRFARTGEPGWRRFTPREPYTQGLSSAAIRRTDFAADHHYAFWSR